MSIQLCYITYYMHQYKQSCRWYSVFGRHTIPHLYVQQNTQYHTCIYNRLPEDEPSGSKHVKDIEKLKY